MSLFDIRSEMFQHTFSNAKVWPDYLKTATESQLQRWQQHHKAITFTPDQSQLLESFVRQMNVLVLSGIWCGDCMRQCPQVQRIAECSSKIDLRFVELNPDSEISRELRIHGASRVPVVVILSEDFFEVARFGDRPLSAYRRKAERELGAACEIGVAPAGGDGELEGELQEWVDFFERAQLVLRTSPLLRGRYGD